MIYKVTTKKKQSFKVSNKIPKEVPFLKISIIPIFELYFKPIISFLVKIELKGNESSL
jgi:hypothetical protein